MENREPFEADFRMRRADGEYRWMKSRAMPRVTDEAHALTYAGCTIDIHDAKLAEAQLALLAAVVNSSQDAIYSFTLDTKIVSWNRAAEALFGWTEAEMLGQKWKLFMPPELSDELDEIVAMVQSGQVVTRLRDQTPAQGRQPFRCVAGVFAGGGAGQHYRDIGDRPRYYASARSAKSSAINKRDCWIFRLTRSSCGAALIARSSTGTRERKSFTVIRPVKSTGGSIHEVLKTAFPISQPEIEAKIYQEGEWDGRLLHTQKTGGRVAVLSRMQRIARPKGECRPRGQPRYHGR